MRGLSHFRSGCYRRGWWARLGSNQRDRLEKEKKNRVQKLKNTKAEREEGKEDTRVPRILKKKPDINVGKEAAKCNENLVLTRREDKGWLCAGSNSNTQARKRKKRSRVQKKGSKKKKMKKKVGPEGKRPEPRKAEGSRQRRRQKTAANGSSGRSDWKRVSRWRKRLLVKKFNTETQKMSDKFQARKL